MTEQPDRLLKCMRCLGTGWRGPGHPDEHCPACEGAGEVPDANAWAGYELSLDFTGGRR